MTVDYDKMTNEELEKELKDTEYKFNKYKEILKQVYSDMSELSENYNKIEQILKDRNDK